VSDEKIERVRRRVEPVARPSTGVSGKLWLGGGVVALALVGVVLLNAQTQALPTGQATATAQALGTLQAVPTVQAVDTARALGTLQALPTVHAIATAEALGTLQAVATAQAVQTAQAAAAGG
jgi:hypothetical protein